MGAKNGHSVFDKITSGYKRNVWSPNSHGSLVVTIPQEFIEEHDINDSDQVAMIEEDGRLLLDFGNDE